MGMAISHHKTSHGLYGYTTILKMTSPKKCSKRPSTKTNTTLTFGDVIGPKKITEISSYFFSYSVPSKYYRIDTPCLDIFKTYRLFNYYSMCFGKSHPWSICYLFHSVCNFYDSYKTFFL